MHEVEDFNIIKLKELSVFFPLYNEEENIEALVDEALTVFSNVAKEFEIILINDGSKDKTKELGEQLEREHKQVRLVNQRNKGYGGAVKRGFAESKYEWVFFSDGDLQFKLEEVDKFIRYTDNYDLIIGYRSNRAEGWKRKLLADLLKIWNKLFFRFPSYIKDIDCAFKLIKREVLKQVMPLESDGAMLSTELLLKAYKSNFRIKQLSVTHYKRKYGKSTGSNFVVIFRAIRDTFLLRKYLKSYK